MANTTVPGPSSIKAINKTSVIAHIELHLVRSVSRSFYASIPKLWKKVRFKRWGLTSFEEKDNGYGIAEKNWECVGLKHYASELSTFADLSIVRSFGFRGEAISSLCALCDNTVVTTATDGPMGIQLNLEHCGKVGEKTKVASAVRYRKEPQRNVNRLLNWNRS